MSAADLFVVVVVVVAFVVATVATIGVATANDDADVDDARSDVDVSARCY
jgi:hypothetical protein